MALKTLSKEEAFKEGSELWIIPDRKNSIWARRIDWHLQFLISRSMIHVSPQISLDLNDIVRANEIDLQVPEISKNAPLLIFSVDLLPNRQTIHLPYSSNLKVWLERAYELWENLKKPSVRIFLPKAQAAEEFDDLWPEAKHRRGVSVVEDIASS
jgi:hypothetical protein